MKYLAIAAAAALMAGQAFAADLGAKKAPDAPPPAKPLIAWPEPNFDILAGGFDYAFGAKFMSNYVSRGISQTANRPGGTFYGELHYGWFYAGVQPWSVRLPTEPFAEVDLYGGIRPVWGPLTLDFGAITYVYPGNRTRYFLAGALPVLTFWTPGAAPTTATDPTYVEIYAKATWAVNDWFTIGGNINYDPNWNNYHARGLYSEVNAKLTIPDTGFSVSGAFGHYYLGYGSFVPYGASIIDPVPFRGFKFSSYNTWNAGASYNWNAITFDARYIGSSMSKSACAVNTSDPAANFAFGIGGIGKSSWCGSKFMGTISLDFTSASFK